MAITVGIMNHGFVMEITPKENSAENVNERNAAINVTSASALATSDENLTRILPVGFV